MKPDIFPSDTAARKLIRSLAPLVVPLLASSCATNHFVAAKSTMSAQPHAAVANLTTELVETSFEIHSYREATDGNIWHDAHIVRRRTRVPIKPGEELSTVPRTTFPPASFSPLPASEELAAEIASQKAITAEMRAIQSSTMDIEQKVQTQYATLVRQSSEAIKWREGLEEERRRGRGASSASGGAAPQSPPIEKSAEVKW